MKITTGILIGAAIGFLWGYFGKCSGGYCPLTRNYWITTVFGALMGLLLTVKK